MTAYQRAGVDLDGAERHVRGIAELVTSTWGPGVVGDFGGFAAGIEVPPGYRRPVMMMSTDGVGTKLEVARVANQWSGVGFDLVAMCVDDLAAVGARPLGFVDYMAVGALDPERDTKIVRSIADACLVAGCALLGGETAEHPGVMETDAIDLAGSVMGVVEHGEQLRPDRVEAGDQIIGLVSPNLRSNGFSLVRNLMEPGLEGHLDALLEPSVIYSPAVLGASETGMVHAAAHITGGGLPGNLIRAVPEGLGASIDTGKWERPEIFGVISALGVSIPDMYDTFNMGIGFCLLVDPEDVDAILTAVAVHDPRVIGVVTTNPGVHLQ
jgi:phosphoribosylformylglycinamidine cyclo-ligase